MKKTTAVTIIAVALIVSLTTFIIFSMYTTHQKNLQIIHECFDDFDQTKEVTISKKGYISTVKCERE